MNISTPLTPVQRRFVVWFSPLANVATNIVTPFVVYQQLKHKPLDPAYKKSILMQEVVRQAISGMLGLVSYSSGAGLMELAMKHSPHKPFAQVISGTITSFIAYAVVRPLMSTEIISQWLTRSGISASKVPTSAVKSTMSPLAFAQTANLQRPASMPTSMAGAAPSFNRTV